MASIQNFIIRNFLYLTVDKERIKKITIEETRQTLIKLTNKSPIPKGVKFEKANFTNVPSEWAIPDNLENDGIVLFLHGGAYVAGSISTHRALVGRLAKASKTKYLSIEYGLAPERPFPHGLDDTIKAYKWLIKEGFDNNKIVICGDSAGGGLTIGALIKIRDEKLPSPAAGVAMSPWLDLLCTGDSTIRLAKEDVMLSPESGKIYANLYAKDNYKNPYASPYYADPKGLPPIYIQVSSSETILDDSTRFEKNAKAVGVDIIVEQWPRMVHVWQAFSPFLPEGTKAIKKLGAYINKKTK